MSCVKISTVSSDSWLITCLRAASGPMSASVGFTVTASFASCARFLNVCNHLLKLPLQRITTITVAIFEKSSFVGSPAAMMTRHSNKIQVSPRPKSSMSNTTHNSGQMSRVHRRTKDAFLGGDRHKPLGASKQRSHSTVSPSFLEAHRHASKCCLAPCSRSPRKSSKRRKIPICRLPLASQFPTHTTQDSATPAEEI